MLSGVYTTQPVVQPRKLAVAWCKILKMFDTCNSTWNPLYTYNFEKERIHGKTGCTTVLYNRLHRVYTPLHSHRFAFVCVYLSEHTVYHSSQLTAQFLSTSEFVVSDVVCYVHRQATTSTYDVYVDLLSSSSDSDGVEMQTAIQESLSSQELRLWTVTFVTNSYSRSCV